MHTLAQIAIYIISSLGSLYLSFVILRFLQQLVRADYYNPLAKAIAKLTNPLLLPLRKIIPGFFGIDFACLILAIVIQAIILQLIILLSGLGLVNFIMLILWSILGILGLTISFYYFGIFIMIIASFVAPYSSHPALSLLRQIIEPIMAPARRILPPMGGLDFSPMLVLIIIQIIKSFLLPLVAGSLGMPSGLLLGL